MSLLRSLNRYLDTGLRYFLAFLFAGMIVVVFTQVFARNVLQVPMVWTLDMAQLLFSWCIFIGAALALRWDAHYVLDLMPGHWKISRTSLKIIAHIGSVIVVGVMLYNGLIFTDMGLTRFAPALGITEFWFFLPIPLSAALMIPFLCEQIPDDIRSLWDGQKDDDK